MVGRKPLSGLRPKRVRMADDVLIPAHRFRKACPHAPYGPYDVQPADPVETVVRHSGWLATRQRVRSALMATGAPHGRVERFDHCGGGCVVEQCQTSGRIRLASNHCHDRFCKPCGDARSKVIAHNLGQHVAEREVRFVTLTLRHVPMRLGLQIDRLLTCLRNLRARAFWQDCVVGGAAFLEIKLSKDGKLWHPHVHLIVEGSYMPQHRLSEEWLAVTGDSSIVDIRLVREVDDVIRYVCKYASKPLDSTIFRSEHHLNEAVLALKGRRLCTTFGTWRGVELEASLPDDGNWQPVCSLTHCKRAAATGEEWAVRLWNEIVRLRNVVEPHDRGEKPP